MAIYKPKQASLEQLEGQGFAYTAKTAFGKTYHGVFFAEEGEALEALKAQEALTFTGVVYERNKAREQTMPVTITNVTSTRAGERADFVAVEEQDAQ